MSNQTDIQADSRQECYCHPQSFPIIDGVIHLPGVTKEYLNQIRDLPVQDEDVFTETYPKSGTTWLSEIVWQILLDGALDMRPIMTRVNFLEKEKLSFKQNNDQEFRLNEFYLNKSFPRVFKTHLPYNQAPKGNGVTKPKHIYVARNPKDTAVSYYWHYKGFGPVYDFDRSWDEFFEMFIKDNVNYGSWFDHVLGWWAHRDDPNILFLKYEDMKKNHRGAVQQIAEFLGKDCPPEMMKRITEQTSFLTMSDSKGRFIDGDEVMDRHRNPGIKFIRKGEVGDWRNYFSEEQNKRFDALYEHKMAGSGLKLEFE